MLGVYVLINSDLGTDAGVIKELKKIPAVVEVDGVYGAYDIVVQVNADSPEKLYDSLRRIRNVKGVKGTLTMTIIKGQGQ